MIDKYDYYTAVYDDCVDYVRENIDRIKGMTPEDAYEELYDSAFVSDSVTGNASGSYTFNTWKAEEYLCHNYDLLQDACKEFCSDTSLLLDGAESADVTIRCYLLSESLNEALNDLEDEYSEPEEDEEE